MGFLPIFKWVIPGQCYGIDTISDLIAGGHPASGVSSKALKSVHVMVMPAFSIAPGLLVQHECPYPMPAAVAMG